MRRVLLFFLLWISGFCLPLQAQTNKKIRNLQARRTELLNQINQSEQVLLTMKKDVKSQLSDLSVLNSQISQQEKLLHTIEGDMGTLDIEIAMVELQLDSLQKDFDQRRQGYEKALKMAYARNQSIQDKLMFVLSARNVMQMYRRARYIREYADNLRAQAKQIEYRQTQMRQKVSDLLAARGEKSSLLRQQEQQKLKLESKQDEQQKLVKALQKKQKDVQKEINQKKKQQESLNAQIDKLIEQEIAAAKKREEERRKREAARKAAEQKRQEEARRKAQEAAAKSPTTGTTTGKATAEVKTTIPKAETAPKMEAYEADNSARKMAGTFERNKGNMPMPITGSYSIVSHYGAQRVAGLAHVSIDNKGIDIKGQAGASARAIFDGEVSAVFSYAGVRGVLVRHGNYISVYCNLSTVSVKQGQQVKTRDVIGKVANSGEEGYVLHFQLRRETTKLNPETWLGR